MTPTELDMELAHLDRLFPREDMLTVAQISGLVQMADATIYDHIRDGKLTARKVGKVGIRITKRDYLEWREGLEEA